MLSPKRNHFFWPKTVSNPKHCKLLTISEIHPVFMGRTIKTRNFLVVLVVVVVLGLPAVKKTSTKDDVLVLDVITP